MVIYEVDWTSMSHSLLPTQVLECAMAAGHQLYLFLKKIFDDHQENIHMDNVHLIGFSYGSHLVGGTGRLLKTHDYEVRKITGKN